MINFPNSNVVIGNREPTWQPEEDRIVGNMLRELFSFEGQIFDEKTVRAMDSIVKSAMRTAEEIGARPDYVESVGARLNLSTIYHSGSIQAFKESCEPCSECGRKSFP